VIAAAIVLAAGHGTRMGAPKALLRVHGEWLLAAHARRLVEAGCARVLVTVPTALRAQIAATLDAPATVLGVDTASQGETLAAALRALQAEAPLGDADRVLVTPVDLRPPALATLNSLAAAAADVVCPRHRGRNGHPLIARWRVLAPCLGDAPPPLDRLVAGLRTWVETDDPATIEDFDAPGDVT
jgi:CTP:molybdopterin cytidylyltransferase MocA